MNSININNTQYDKNNIDTLKLEDEAVGIFLKEWFSGKQEFIITTSGSTGTPKPISISKSGLIRSAEITIDRFQLQENQTAFLCLPARYIAGKMMLVRALVGKLKLRCHKPSSNPVKDIDQDIDFGAFTPHQLNSILEANPDQINRFKTVIIGGAPTDQILRRKLQDLRPRFYATYGMTETITHCAIQALNGSEQSDRFQLLKSFEIDVTNEGTAIISANHIPTSPITTNDLIETTDFKSFTISGRLDNIVNSGGLKLHPEQIEKQLSILLPENRFFLIGTPDKLLGEKLTLVVENYDGNTTVLQSEIIKITGANRAPKSIFNCPQFLETETGKIQRQKTINSLL